MARCDRLTDLMDGQGKMAPSQDGQAPGLLVLGRARHSRPRHGPTQDVERSLAVANYTARRGMAGRITQRAKSPLEGGWMSVVPASQRAGGERIPFARFPGPQSRHGRV